MFGTIVFILSFVYRTIWLPSYEACPGCKLFIEITVYVDAIFYCVGFILSFVSGIIHCDKNIKFVLTFQEVHRFINNEIFSRRFIILNWVVIITFHFGYIFLVNYFFVKLHISFFYMICFSILVFNHFHVIYATRVIMLLEDKITLWNIQALYSQKIEQTLRRSYCEKVFQAYVSILKCYDINKDCFQQIVSIIFLTSKAT